MNSETIRLTRKGFIGGALAMGAMGAISASAAGDGGKRWYKGMLHMHTHWSDGKALPEQAVAYYKDAGYDFAAVTDHNRYGTDPDKWKNVSPKPIQCWISPDVHEGQIDAFAARFKTARFRTKNGKRQVRITPMPEVEREFNADGKFLLLPGVEVTDVVTTHNPEKNRMIHMNVIGIDGVIDRAGKAGFNEYLDNYVVSQTIRETKDLVDELARKRGISQYLFMVNHPHWPYYDIVPDDFMSNPDIRYFEIGNGCGAGFATQEKSGLPRDGYDCDRIWDAVLANRCARGEQLLYGFGSDDTHYYPGIDLPRPTNVQDGFIMVRAAELTREAILTAIAEGDFYACSGMTIEDVVFDRREGRLEVKVPAKKDVSYRIRFITTKKGVPLAPIKVLDASPKGAEKSPKYGQRKVPIYDARVGAVVKTVEGAAGEALSASYRLAADDLYVRARVESSEPSTFAAAFPKRDPLYFQHPPVRCVWTQPYRR